MLRVEEDVGALDVAVYQALAVEELQRPRRVRQDGHPELPSDLLVSALVSALVSVLLVVLALALVSVLLLALVLVLL